MIATAEGIKDELLTFIIKIMPLRKQLEQTKHAPNHLTIPVPTVLR
jgi:hypothetical protein